jgi:hypothetical protein
MHASQQMPESGFLVTAAFFTASDSHTKEKA